MRCLRYFFKLNLISAIFALVPFIVSELLVNVYRINRITGVEIDVVHRSSGLAGLACFLGSVGTFALMIKKRFLPVGKVLLLSAITWIPYYWLYVRIAASRFPMSNPADDPNPVSGLIIFAGLLVYPFILAGINALVLLFKRHHALIQ